MVQVGLCLRGHLTYKFDGGSVRPSLSRTHDISFKLDLVTQRVRGVCIIKVVDYEYHECNASDSAPRGRGQRDRFLP